MNFHVIFSTDKLDAKPLNVMFSNDKLNAKILNVLNPSYEELST